MSKRVISLIILCVVVSMITGCSGGTAKAPEPVDENQEVRIYEIFGMDCPACHGGVEKLALKIPAILEAKANWVEARLVVILKPGAQLEDELVFDAVRRANFTPGKRIQ